MDAPSRDEFDAWRDNPVTQFVIAGLTRAADLQVEEFKALAWNVPADGERWETTRLFREKCRGRVEAYRDLAALNVDDAYGINGLEPPPAVKESA